MTEANPSTRDAHAALENRLAAIMFTLAALFLMLVAAAIHQVRTSDERLWNSSFGRVIVAGLLLLWPVFLLEEGWRYWLTPLAKRTWKTLVASLTIAVAPPARMGAHGKTWPEQIWLPRMGWRDLDFDLQKDLEQNFSGPMFLMALLILPVLAIEYFWSSAVETYPLLRTALGIGVSVIWIAFTVEFILRFSVAEKKLGYALDHWVDLAVVLLPALEFLPFLRLLRATRLMRLQNFARMAKYYRLYGVAGKGWRGLVVLQLIQRWFSRSPQDRLSRLQGCLEGKQQETRELEREIDYYQRRIAAAERDLKESPTSTREG